MGVNNWRGTLEVKVAAEARDGAANGELIAFLSARLGVPKNSIRILKGDRSPHKVIEVPLPEQKVRALLESD